MWNIWDVIYTVRNIQQNYIIILYIPVLLYQQIRETKTNSHLKQLLTVARVFRGTRSNKNQFPSASKQLLPVENNGPPRIICV